MLSSRPLPRLVPLTPLAFTLVVVFATTIDRSDEIATIHYHPDYQALPSCINQCLWDIDNDDTVPLGGNMGAFIACPPPHPNSCYCDPQAAPQVHSFITSCARALCSDPSPDDIARGTSVYGAYCRSALAGEDSLPPAETATEAPTMTGIASSVKSTQSVPTEAGTSAADPATGTAVNNDSPGLSQTDKIALGVGIGVGLPATLATITMCVAQVVRRKRPSST